MNSVYHEPEIHSPRYQEFSCLCEDGTVLRHTFRTEDGGRTWYWLDSVNYQPAKWVIAPINACLDFDVPCDHDAQMAAYNRRFQEWYRQARQERVLKQLVDRDTDRTAALHRKNYKISPAGGRAGVEVETPYRETEHFSTWQAAAEWVAERTGAMV